MRRLLVSSVVLAVIVLVPVVVYAVGTGTNGRSLRARIGECSALQTRAHPAACAYIDAHPAIELSGPIDETGTPFAHALHVAGDRRAISLHLDSGRYAVFLEIDRRGTVRSNVMADVDLSTGGRNLGTLTPAEPWEPTGVPGA